MNFLCKIFSNSSFLFVILITNAIVKCESISSFTDEINYNYPSVTDSLQQKLSKSQQQLPINQQAQSQIPNIASRLGESVLLECGKNEHELLRQLESSVPSMPVLVNWFKHYSYTRRSDKPIYAKYLANNIDYAPHVSRDYENRLQVVDKINLNISNLKAIDEALYECRLILFDKAYADSQTGSMFYLQVHVAPEFEYPNEEIVYYKPNAPIRLYCYAKGKPTPSITWYKNNVKLDANTSVLQETFTSQYDEEGSLDMFEYRCKAENIVGQIEHTVKVIRSGSLFFTEPLKNLTVTEGTILNWPCLAQSNAEITYKWFKDSISVQSHLHKWSDRGALFQDGMLYLLETYRNDSGLYECHAYTSNKRIETSAYLNVLYGPEIVPFQSPLYAMEESKSITIDCVVKSNPSVIALEWFKDKYLLSNTNKYQILPNNSLVIHNVQKADRGQYYCTCNNTIRKAVSSIVKLEIVDSRRVEITTLYSSSSHNTFKLPCRALLSSIKLHSMESSEFKFESDDIKWYKINSRLPPNRYSIDTNGSLILQNLRSSDSGMYLCKLSEQQQQITNSRQLQNNAGLNRTKNFIQYSIDKSAITVEKIIKLNVIQNKSSNSDTSASVSSENNNSNDLNSNEITAEIPLCPENIQINQTSNGILLSWQYPAQTPVKIEYFQIYFREINERLTSTSSPGERISSTLSSLFSASLHEWKTTESIQSNLNSYFIDDSNLNENQLYEFQLVSFSIYSKSLPSQTMRIKYVPRVINLSNRPPYLNMQSSHTNLLTNSNDFSIDHLLNMSQLDIILITIFLILICILIICIIACVVYRRSSRSSRKRRNSKKIKEIDDWGFQSSSAATATFLSSSSSSEKSFNVFKQNKTQRSSAIDCDLNNKPINTNKLNEINSNNVNDDEDDDDDNNNERDEILRNQNIIRNEVGVNDVDDDQEDDDEIDNHDVDDEDDDEDYYYSKDDKNSSSSANSQQRNSSAFSGSSTTGVGSTKASSSSSSSSSGTSNTINNISGTSSGITSVSGTSTNSVESSHEESLQVTNDSVLAINTIKYNAKTNILHEQQKQHFGKKQSKKQPASKQLKSNMINTRRGEYIKLDKNNKNKQIKFNVKPENSTSTTSTDSSCSSIRRNEHDYGEYCYATTDGIDFNTISVDTNNIMHLSQPPPSIYVSYSQNNVGKKPPNKSNLYSSPTRKDSKKSTEIDYYSWIPNMIAGNSISPSVTPAESSTYSTSSITPPLIPQPNQIYSTNALYQTVNLNKNSPLPFPTNHFINDHNNRLDTIRDKQFMQLNSSSSLTVVSKVPSSSYCYITSNDGNSNKGAYLNAINDGSSSSSSGCSSLENQYYSSSKSSETTRTLVNRNSLNDDHARTESLNRMQIEKKIISNQPGTYSTYRPVLKSNILNSNCKNINTPQLSNTSTSTTAASSSLNTPTRKITNTNSNTNNNLANSNAVVRNSKIDYV